MKATTVAGGTPDDPAAEQAKASAPGPGPAVPAPTEPQPQPGADPEAEVACAAEAEPEAASSAEAEPEAAAQAEKDPAPQAEAEAVPEPEADAAVEPDVQAKAAADAEAAPATKTTPDPRTKSGQETGPKTTAGPEAGPTASAGPEAGPTANAGPEAAPTANAGPEAAPKADAGSEAGTKTNAGPEVGPKSGAESGAGAKANAGSEAGPKANAGPEAGAETEARAKANAGPEAGAETEARAKANAGPEAGAETGAGAQPKTGANNGTRAKANTGSEAGPQADAGRKSAAKTGTGTGTGAQPKAGAGADVRAKAGAGPGVEGRTATPADGGARVSNDTPVRGGAGTGTGAAVAAASDGEGPAGGAGAGAEVGPAGAAGAGDPRQVPSWARAAESDSERTSRFVALKPLDTQAPAPAPAPAPEPRPRPVRAPAPTDTPPAPAPLGLLAGLTNTAPPPVTPRRTALRRVAIWTPVVLLLAGGFAGAQLLRPLPAPKLVPAATGHTVDGQFSIPWPAKGQGAVRVAGSGDLGTFGEQKPVPTASVAKVMTAYVILKNHPLKKSEPGPAIKVDAKTVADGTSENESRITGLTVGSEFSQQDMLKMLMIPSGNNVARLLARWDTGTDSEAAFVEKMNAAARELGMTNTTYTDPSGLDAGTTSTATDQLKLAEAVMKDEAFRAIVALPSATIKGLPKPLVNNNDLLTTASGLSIRGIKTGSSTPAGGALMWAAYKSVGDETPLILGTLMEQRVDGPDLNAEKSLELVKANSKKIIEAVRSALASAPVVRKGDTVGYVDDGLGGRTPLVAAKDLNVIGVPGQQVKLTLAAGAPELPHTAKAGTEVAVLTAGEGAGARSVPVAVGGELAEPSFGTRLTRLG